jgi:hypothetical protein
MYVKCKHYTVERGMYIFFRYLATGCSYTELSFYALKETTQFAKSSLKLHRPVGNVYKNICQYLTKGSGNQLQINIKNFEIFQTA